MKFLRIASHILEVIVLGVLITMFYFAMTEKHIDEKKIKREADKESNENLDKLNNLDYLDKFDDSTAVDSIAK